MRALGVYLERRLPADDSRVLSLVLGRIDRCPPHHYSDDESDCDKDQGCVLLRCDMQVPKSNRKPTLKSKVRLRGSNNFLFFQLQPEVRPYSSCRLNIQHIVPVKFLVGSLV